MRKRVINRKVKPLRCFLKKQVIVVIFIRIIMPYSSVCSTPALSTQQSAFSTANALSAIDLNNYGR
jgi:hypothetical protein